jgi:DNA-binding response OmpR family regulator
MDIWRPPERRSSLDRVQSLLLAEPEPETRDYLERNLRDDGFAVLGAGRDGEALDLAERARPHLVLAADVELCRRLREGEPGRSWDRNVPVIVLAPARADPVLRVRAFDRGADDVVERPIVYLELLARIRALLRRALPGAGEVLDAGDVVVDRRTRLVHVRGAPVQLAGREFELAAMLAREPRRVFTKDELLRDVWGFRSAGRTRTLDSHASRLRRKLRLAEDDRFVVNVWGVGYRLLD